MRTLAIFVADLGGWREPQSSCCVIAIDQTSEPPEKRWQTKRRHSLCLIKNNWFIKAEYLCDQKPSGALLSYLRKAVLMTKCRKPRRKKRNPLALLKFLSRQSHRERNIRIAARLASWRDGRLHELRPAYCRKTRPPRMKLHHSDKAINTSPGVESETNT